MVLYQKLTQVRYNVSIRIGYGSQTAFIWEGNEPGDSYSITFQDLLDKVVIFSAVLRKHGVRKVNCKQKPVFRASKP